jgi:hypothetical protein
MDRHMRWSAERERPRPAGAAARRAERPTRVMGTIRPDPGSRWSPRRPPAGPRAVPAGRRRRPRTNELVASLGPARVVVVVDHFHAIRLANAVVDQVRRRTQQATLGHRGRKHDPLYRIRRLLLTAAEQLTSRGWVRLRAGLTAGDPTGEVAAAWQAKELLRAVYAAVDTPAARAALERFYRWADGVGVAGLSRLARTVRAWEARSWPACHRWLFQRAHRGRQPPGQEGPSASGTASATSSTTGCGCCSTAGSPGGLTRPRACEGAPHVWWYTARNPRGGRHHHDNAVPQAPAHQAWLSGQ